MKRTPDIMELEIVKSEERPNNVCKFLVPDGTQHNTTNEFFLGHPFFKVSICFKMIDAHTSAFKYR
ncbi:hypothetical protein EUTSA_v10026744mg [Eutrema salsugineum]|uniref:Uncharacterized protein n=1 Tax=Eutrema salsugineum TaxID=72664 RepID=V4MEN0_EUTSA|nr:hypothetical protein EUTSA_v10026744mg [Eutrema salsugineum]